MWVMSRLSEAQGRAVETLAGEEGWVRRGTIQQKTMDVLVRLDMAEEKRDTAIHVTVYRATQNARDWVRGQQDDAVPKTSAESARVTAVETVETVGRSQDDIDAVAYLPSMLTAIGTDKPWDEELVSSTEAMLSILANLTPDDLSMIDDASDLDAWKSRPGLESVPTWRTTSKRKGNTASRRHRYPKGK